MAAGPRLLRVRAARLVRPWVIAAVQGGWLGGVLLAPYLRAFRCRVQDGERVGGLVSCSGWV